MYDIDAHEYYKQLTMDLEQRLNDVFKSLEQNGFTIPTLIRSVLESSTHSYHHNFLLFGVPSICSDLLAYNQTGVIFSQTFETVKSKNLYTKVSDCRPDPNSSLINLQQVIFAGTGPNRTIKHIIQESPLIELYQDYHVTIENGFHLEHCTIRHKHPDMMKTLQRLCTGIEQSLAHSFTAGHRAKMVIPDQIAAAMNTMQKKKKATANNDDEIPVVEADDLMDD